jgi:tetrahydromethanopterin S-methyltransferase subunit G
LNFITNLIYLIYSQVYPKGLKDIAYHLWTREQIKSFNKWVVKHHKKDITDFIGIPNLANYVVIDIDSKEEVEKLKHTGIVDKIHTKSIRKRLPHILVKVKDVDFMVKDVSKILGKSKGRDIDMITNVIYEKIDGEVYGEDIAELTLNEIGENIFGDKKLIIMRQGIVSQRIIAHSKKKIETISKPKSNQKTKKKKMTTTTTMQTDINDTQKELDHIIYIDEKYCEEFTTNYDDADTKIPSRGEILPMETLDEILNHIDYSKIDNYQDWKTYVIAFANQVDTHGKYQMLWKSLLYKTIKFPSYKEEYNDETLNLYHHIVNRKELNEFPNNPISVNTIWKMLMESDREKWKELAFHKDRVIEGSLFKDLTTTEGLNVFNEHFGMVSDGDSSFYVEWNGSKQDFTMYSEASLIKCFKHLSTYYLAKDDEGNEKKVKVKNFIKTYLEHDNKSIYQGQTFSPPPLKPRWNEYNFYRGFKADKDREQWDIVNSLCKEQLEDELDFMLNHLRILSGEEDTEKCFQYNLKFYAHLLKFPAKLPRVMIIYRSEQGVGKNRWLDFISNIVGSTYYATSEKIEQFVGNFNWSVAYKLLVNINELEEGYKFVKELKTLIADGTLNATKKFHDTLALPNFARYVGATNKEVYITLENGDRRFCIFRCNNKYVLLPMDSVERKKYFETLTACVESKYLQKCFLRYCREFVDVDINYNFELNRPITTEYLKVKSQNQPISHKFFQFLYEFDIYKGEHTKRSLFSDWGCFLKQYNEKYSCSQQTFITNYLESHCLPHPSKITEEYLTNNMDKFIHKSNEGKKQYYYTIDEPRLLAFFEKNLYKVDKPTPKNDSSDDE